MYLPIRSAHAHSQLHKLCRILPISVMGSPGSFTQFITGSIVTSKAERLSRKVFVGCSVSTETVSFAKFGAHRAPYETAPAGKYRPGFGRGTIGISRVTVDEARATKGAADETQDVP